MTMANKKNIKIWVDALRSGKFGQIKHFLERNNKYCCVGVACETAIANGVSIKRTITDHTDNIGHTTGYGEDNCTGGMAFPYQLCDWLGISASMLGSYANLNDQGRSFSEIADVIENNWLRS